MSRVARGMLELPRGKAASHIPDGGAGGRLDGPMTGTAAQVNSSIGGQLKRYKPGFVFTAFSVYDLESGKWIYTSSAHSNEPAPMRPGPPPRGVSGPGAAASGVEFSTPPSAVASRPTKINGGRAGTSGRGFREAAISLPIEIPQSARGAGIAAGGLIALSVLNSLLNWFAGRKQTERLQNELKALQPAIAKQLKDNPRNGVIVVVFFHQVIPHPDSLIEPGPVFSHLEYEFGATREKAIEKWISTPSLRPYWGKTEREERQFLWVPPPEKLPATLPQPIVFPELELGRIDDPAEREAETIADRVMLMRDGGACCSACASGGPCASHAEEIEQEQVGPIRRQGSGNGGGLPVPADLEPQVRRATSGGEALPRTVRAFFEPRFGQDLSHVRIHRDADAAASATALGARAYTRGEHIAFASGRFAPGADAGDRLIAHELTHVIQQNGSSGPVRRDFVPEQAAEEMVGKTFSLNAEVDLSGAKFPRGANVVVTKWANEKTLVEISIRWGRRFVKFDIDKKYLVPAGDSKSGLPQYHAGVAGIETRYAALEKKISGQEKTVSDLKGQEAEYRTPKGRAEWQRKMDVAETELRDSKYKLTGEGYTPTTLPERLKTEVKGKKVSITPQSTLLNTALIQETMFNAFDAGIVHWVAFYNKSIGSPKKWPALEPDLVKSLLYQESQMGTQGPSLLPPPYAKWQRKTRFNIGQAIDSSGPQQILMMKELSPGIAARHNLDEVIKDMHTAQIRRKELAAKGAKIDAAEQAELQEIDDRCVAGLDWNRFFTTDARWFAAVEEFFLETTPLRNLDYDFWIRTAVRWLFEKRAGVNDWDAAIKAYNGSSAKAEIYKQRVIGRKDAARAAGNDFIPTQTN